jgi:hypothetical protein
MKELELVLEAEASLVFQRSSDPLMSRLCRFIHKNCPDYRSSAGVKLARIY